MNPAIFDGPVLGSLLTRVQRMGYACRLLLDRRMWMFVAGDIFFIFIGILEAIDAASGSDLLQRIYGRVVVMPMLLLGLPAMSGVLALERRAGSLDLALAVPSTERYIRRRVLPICALMILQGWIILWISANGWELARAFLQCATLALLLTTITLFWAVRLRTSGAVLVASLVTVAVLSPWITVSPVMQGVSIGAAPRIWGVPLEVLEWSWSALVQALAALIFYLYARERMRRPESMSA